MKKIQALLLIPIILFILLGACGWQVQDNSEVKLNKTFCQSNNQIASQIFEIFEDRDGNMWFGTYDKGVAQYDGTSLRYFSEENGLCGKTVANIAQDESGDLWFGTYSDMCKIDYSNLSAQTEISFDGFEKDSEGVPHLGWGWKSVHTDKKGQVYVNTHHGIFQFINDEFVKINVPAINSKSFKYCNTPGDISLDLIDSEGNLWFGTDGDGVYKYDGQTFKNISVKDGLLGSSVFGIEEDANGHIWFACTKSPDSNDNSKGGLCKYDGRHFTAFKELDGLYDNNMHTIYKDKSGNIWAGATGYGVYKFENETPQFYPEPAAINTTNSFFTAGLQSIFEDSKGRIWLGFSGGLYRLDNDKIINITQNGPWT